MKILAASDLHGDFGSLQKLCDAAGDFDIMIIAGDVTNFSSRKVSKHILDQMKDTGKNILIVHGNCDLHETVDFFDSQNVSLHGKGKIIGDIGFFGLGGSNRTPFNTPLEYSEEEISDILEKGYKDIEDSKIKVLVSHAPPFESVDLLPNGENVGSEGLRDFIKNHPVDLVICGHIHECKGIIKLSNTIVLNTGPAFKGFAKVTLENNKIMLDEFVDF